MPILDQLAGRTATAWGEDERSGEIRCWPGTRDGSLWSPEPQAGHEAPFLHCTM